SPRRPRARSACPRTRLIATAGPARIPAPRRENRQLAGGTSDDLSEIERRTVGVPGRSELFVRRCTDCPRYGVDWAAARDDRVGARLAEAARGKMKMRALAREVGPPAGGGPLDEDARLADGLRAPRGAPPGRPSEILLTGVTGFLGGEIAAALLRATAARLHCVVRGHSGRPARERLQRLCRRLDVDPARLVLVESDLFSVAADEVLAHRIDTVVHCAASVNLFAPYAELRPTNVLGARAVLELATRGAPKALHYVSTVGVFLSPRYRGATVFEDDVVAGARPRLRRDHLPPGVRGLAFRQRPRRRSRRRGVAAAVVVRGPLRAAPGPADQFDPGRPCRLDHRPLRRDVACTARDVSPGEPRRGPFRGP